MGKEDKQVKQHYYVTHHRNYTHAGLQYDNSYHLVGMDGAGPAEANGIGLACSVLIPKCIC